MFQNKSILVLYVAAEKSLVWSSGTHHRLHVGAIIHASTLARRGEDGHIQRHAGRTGQKKGGLLEAALSFGNS